MCSAGRVARSGRVVGALHRAVRAAEEHQALERVAAVARHVVQLHAAAGHRRVGAGRVDRHLLHRGEAGRAAQRLAEADRRRGRDAADGLPLLGRLAAVNGEVGEAVARRAADVLRRERVGVGAADAAARAEDDAGLERGEVDAETAGRNGVDDFLRDDLLDRGALHVDERRFAGDGDRFGDRADLHVRVDRRDERCPTARGRRA